MSQPSGSRFVFTAPFDLYAELQRLDRIAGSIGASTEIDSSYDDAARELVSKLRGTVTEGPDPIGGWVAADDVNRLVREIDVALNGADAAPQAALCDIAGQVCKVSREGGPILKRLGAPPKPASAVPLLDRDAGGRIVREAWMRWALTQACPKPSWLVPYDDLPEADKEADRQIFEACAGGATAADVVPETWREFVTACANTGGGEVCGNQLSARAKSLLEALPKNPAADERGKCAHCGVLCSIGAFIPDGRWVCSADCHVLLSRAEGRGPVLKTPEGWQITRNEVGGIRVDGPDGEWLSIDESAPNMGRALMERRLLYGLAEALLTAAPQNNGENSSSSIRGRSEDCHAGELPRRDAAGSDGGCNPSGNGTPDQVEGQESSQHPTATTPIISQPKPVGRGDETVSDTTAALIEMVRQRDAVGRAKYGTTLDGADLTHAEWLQHLAEEMLGGAGYALAAIRTLKADLVMAPEVVVRARFESCAQGFHSRDYADGYLDALQHVASERQPLPTIQNGES